MPLSAVLQALADAEGVSVDYLESLPPAELAALEGKLKKRIFVVYKIHFYPAVSTKKF